MSGTAVTLPSGATAVRTWSVVRTENGLVVNVWSSPRQKLLCAAFGLLLLVPGYLLWDLVGSHSTSRLHWMAAMLYTVVAFFSTVVMVDVTGREIVRLDATGITVRRFSVFAWVTDFLETTRGAEVTSSADRGAAPMRAVAVYTSSRRIDFGRWLPPEAGATIAAHLRDAIEEPTEWDALPDGVVRRVTRHHSRHTPVGADDLIAEEDQNSHVVGGLFLWGARPLPWAAVFWMVWIGGALVGAFEGDGMRFLYSCLAAGTFGVIACRGGIIDRIAMGHRRDLERTHADEPWRAVPYWTDNVIAMPVWRRCVPSVGAITLGLAGMAWALTKTWGRVHESSIGFMVLAGIWCVFWTYRLQNVIFQGLTEVRVREMPVPARRDVVLDFAVARRGADFDSISFSLLRIVEIPRVAEGAFVGYSHRADYELPEDQPPPAPGEQVEIRFALPDDASGTDVTRGRPVYWILQVVGETSSGHYFERFPVPIYDVPAAVDAA